MGFIFSDRAVPDTAFTASSIYSADYAAHKARIDNYLTATEKCYWSAGSK